MLFGQGIDPNVATAETLEAVPGVGPARAAAIVTGRAGGVYRTLSDLERVPGIGPVTRERMAAWLVFPAGSSPATTRPKPGAAGSNADAGEGAP